MQAEIDNLTFEEWWAELSDLVRAWLLRRRVSPHLTDDIVQETGLRLFKMWDEIDALRSPRGLAFTIASNLLWDERNRRASREIVGEVPEQSREDVERAGIARLELARVRRAMSRLTPQHRAVLLAEIGDDETPVGSPDAVKMMRMRARRRLTAILESAPAGAFILLRAPRHLWRTFRSARRGSGLHVPGAAIVAACTTLAVFGTPPTVPSIDGATPAMTARTTLAQASAAAGVSAVDGAASRSSGNGGAESEGTSVSSEEDSGHHVHVDVGEGTPVRGRADISITPAEGFTVEVTECWARPEGTDSVRVKCHAQAGDQEVDVDGALGVDPPG